MKSLNDIQRIEVEVEQRSEMEVNTSRYFQLLDDFSYVHSSSLLLLLLLYSSSSSSPSDKNIIAQDERRSLPISTSEILIAQTALYL